MLSFFSKRFRTRRPTFLVSVLLTYIVIAIRLSYTGEGVLEFKDFVIAMSGVTKEPLDEWDLKQVFKVFDSNDDSFISPNEMHRAFLTLGIDLTHLEIQDIFHEFDEDDDGLISYDGTYFIFFTLN